jgi:hypothetical protein
MNLALPVKVTACGRMLDTSPGCLGELRPSEDAVARPEILRQRLAEDGYLYVPGFFEEQEAIAVRRELAAQLEQAGRLDPDYPLIEVRPCPADKTPKFPRGGAFPSDRRHPVFQKFLYGEPILEFYASLLDGPVRHYDHTWIRAVNPGPGTGPHCDLVYMGRGTPNVFTAWIPYGEIPLEMGGLMILEKSHTYAREKLKRYLETDVDAYCSNRPDGYKMLTGMLSNNPVSLREKLGGRWLTAHFRAGDLLTFGMTTVHASMDNHSSFIRLSTDTRYQRADEPIDERWIGPHTEEYGLRNRKGRIC